MIYNYCMNKIEKPLENTIPRKVKELRKAIGVTQVEFARRAGVGLRFLRELEQGKKTIRLDKLTQILEFLGYHLEIRVNEPLGIMRKEKP